MAFDAVRRGFVSGSPGFVADWGLCVSADVTHLEIMQHALQKFFLGSGKIAARFFL